MIKNKGFTLFEVIIIIAVLAILVAVIIPNFNLIKNQSDVDNSAQEFVGVLKFAQSRTLASEDNKQYGIYIDVLQNQYILFKGTSYAAREVAADRVYLLPEAVEFYSVSQNEFVFERLTGTSQQSGNVSLRIKTDASQNKTVYILASGSVGFSTPEVLSDDSRIKDWRHAHIKYSRSINTATENVVLDFNNGAAIETIPIAENLISGQLDWEGAVNVNGTDQTVSIRTHYLNDPDLGGTQFSIHRDRRYNNVSLQITISGDVSGYLANYSADGSNVDYISIYASNLQMQ